MWFYDIFICHASEDKDDFVRPLAEQLREEHLEVWYDEFSMKVGDSLRRSIDLGISRSRFGVVVLSERFFQKRWPQRELDGLVARQMTNGEITVLPVWLGISAKEICAYSPPLADVVAVAADRGLEHVVQEIVKRVRPQGSPLVIARDELIRRGIKPPVVTDEWWLNVVEASNREPAVGFVPQRRHWGRWTFPLPPDGTNAQERGERLAWTALQMAWEEAAERESISQMTPPEEVLAFIRSQAGLAEVCHENPHYLAEYAPQLVIRGLGGEFEEDLEAEYRASCAEWEERRRRKDQCGSALSTDGLPPGCDERYALRHPDLGFFDPANLACQFVQGELGGPSVQAYENADYIFWLLSEKSDWLPTNIRKMLVEGTKRWAAWAWDNRARNSDYDVSDRAMYSARGALFDALVDAKTGDKFRLSPEALADIHGRATESVEMLGLPEAPQVLADRFVGEGYVEQYLAKKETRLGGMRRSKRAEK